MKLKDALSTAKKRHSASVLHKNRTQTSRPATVSGVCRFFNFTFERQDYGVPPTVTKEEIRMVSGFINVLRRNHYADTDIYKLVEAYISSFGTFKNKVLYTGKGKKHTVGVRPNLKDLLFCKDSIINMLNKVQDSGKSAENAPVDWSKEQFTNTEKW